MREPDHQVRPQEISGYGSIPEGIPLRSQKESHFDPRRNPTLVPEGIPLNYTSIPEGIPLRSQKESHLITLQSQKESHLIPSRFRTFHIIIYCGITSVGSFPGVNVDILIGDNQERPAFEISVDHSLKLIISILDHQP